MAGASFISLLKPGAAGHQAQAEVYDFRKKTADPVQTTKDDYAKSSSEKSLKSLENGGVASRAEFRTPKFFRS